MYYFHFVDLIVFLIKFLITVYASSQILFYFNQFSQLKLQLVDYEFSWNSILFSFFKVDDFDEWSNKVDETKTKKKKKKKKKRDSDDDENQDDNLDFNVPLILLN